MSRRVLSIIVALLVFDLGIGGYYWVVVRPQKANAGYVERPVEAEGVPEEEEHLQLSAKVKAVRSDGLLLETKDGLKEVAIDERTSFFVFTGGNVVEGEGIESVEVGKEVEVVYPKPAEGEIPTAISVLVKD